jgi:hypothetical protein
MNHPATPSTSTPIDTRRPTMNNSTMPATNALTPQQQKLRRKLKEDMAKVLNRRPIFAQERYAHMVANAGDWIIAEQAPQRLPLSLCQLIPLALRDLGNRLLEETRVLNNEYVGLGFRTAEVMVTGAPEFLDLHACTLAWSGEVAKQVNFKLRHQARDDPYRAFLNAYDAIVAPIDQKIVHGKERLHSLVWESVVDLLPYQLLDAMVLLPGHFTLSHGATPAHRPQLTVTRDVASPQDQERLQSILSLYAVEPVAYMDRVVLTPLLAALREDTTLPSPEQRRQEYQLMFADLVEAYPYLLSSDRTERYMFSIPGTSCIAAFSFLAPNGCGRIMVSDDVDSLRRGMHTNFMRGALNVGYDGHISWWMHPWRTLEKVFGEEAATTLSWWLLKQVHGQLVKDYLAIQRYYLDQTDAQAAELEAGDIADEALLYVSLARASEGQRRMEDADPGATPGTPDTEVARGATKLPQLRRRYFFKLLEHCGVEIAQGKGSEIKLLRRAKRPFRLGDHYGGNPTIPAFLAANILKRLEISSEEWIEAIAAH